MSSRGIRGGSWGDLANGLDAAFRYNLGDPTIENNSVGFRIASPFSETAAVPEPSTFVLAALGILGLGCVALRKKFRWD